MPTSFPIPSSSTQALFPLTNWLNQWLNRFLDGSQFLLFPGVEDNKMAGISNDVLSAILDKMHLGHLIENFQREKVTVDQIRVLASVTLLYIPRAFWVAPNLELFVTSTSWAPFFQIWYLYISRESQISRVASLSIKLELEACPRVFDEMFGVSVEPLT